MHKPTRTIESLTHDDVTIVFVVDGARVSIFRTDSDGNDGEAYHSWILDRDEARKQWAAYVVRGMVRGSEERTRRAWGHVQACGVIS